MNMSCTCSYCGVECATIQARIAHEALCTLNPVVAGTVDTGLVTAGLLWKYHQHPVLGSSRTMHSTVTLTTPVVLAALIAGFTHPDVPRNLVLTGNAGANEVITVTGLDVGGGTISEDFTLSGTTPIVGAKAFALIKTVVFPAGTHTVAFAYGSVVGLAHKLTSVLDVIQNNLNLADDTGTAAVSATVLSLNTFAVNGALDGTKPLDILYLVRP
jgi:hypothetical protein